MNEVSIAVSVAEQNFHTATSLGILNTSLGLICALANHPDVRRIRIFANTILADRLPRSDRAEIEIHDSPARGPARRVCWEQIGIHRSLAGKGDDWLLLPKGFASFVTPCPTRLAVYIHDIMAVTFADRYPGSVSRVKQAYFAACYRASLDQARVVLTNTEFTRRELEGWAARHGLRCPPVVVAGYGVDRPPPAGDVAEKEDRVLVFVRRSPHKRTDLALKYVEQWRKQGGYRGLLTALGSLPAGLRLPGDGTWTHEDRLSPADYAGLLGRSRVAVHFSEYEGFGMPPLEAVLAGACPVYSDLPPEREVMSGAGWPFDIQSYESFATAMNQAMATSPEQVTTWKDRLMARHDWPTVADRVVSALREFA